MTSWCNADAAVLKQVAPDVMEAPRAFLWNGIDVGGRMVVVKTEEGLVVHSPVALDEETREAIDALGAPVAIVVAPNFEHLKFTGQWQDAYPTARVVGPPGVAERLPDVRVDDELAAPPPPYWPRELQYAVLDDVEVNPLTNRAFFNEIVLVHAPSRTLITADLFWNYPDGLRWKEALWKFGMDRLYRPLYNNLMVDGDRRTALNSKVARLDFDRIIPCHGTIVETGGKDVLLRHLNIR